MSKVTITLEDVINNNDEGVQLDYDIFEDEENSSAVAVAGAMADFAKQLLELLEEDFKNTTTETEH
jgi:hypothetical protein